jgi:hypothetical protein
MKFYPHLQMTNGQTPTLSGSYNVLGYHLTPTDGKTPNHANAVTPSLQLNTSSTNVHSYKKTRNRILGRNRPIDFEDFLELDKNTKATMDLIKTTRLGYQRDIKWDKDIPNKDEERENLQEADSG